jgi:hypothetical protein
VDAAFLLYFPGFKLSIAELCTFDEMLLKSTCQPSSETAPWPEREISSIGCRVYRFQLA